MTTVTGNSAATTETTPVSREVAMQHLASGRTAQGRRSLAASPVIVEGFAQVHGVTPDVMRAELLNIAAAMDAVTAGKAAVS
jgi:hypothetical protein